MEFTSDTAGLVIAAVLAYLILSSIFKSRSTEGPDEIVANIHGWNWDPNEYAKNGAHSTLQDCEQSFTGDMDSIGCLFAYCDNLAWFGDKQELLSFVESDYVYLTDKYSSRDQQTSSYDVIVESYEKVVIPALDDLQQKDNWSVEDIKKILCTFSSREEKNFQWFTFKYLCHEGDDIFSFRKDFRLSEDGESHDGPIKDDELDEFKEHMSSVWQ